MNLPVSPLHKLIVVGAVTLLCAGMRTDAPESGRRRLGTRMLELPSTTLWVWERPEDLRSIDAGRVAIAWLDQTIVLGSSTASVPRREPFVYPTGAKRIAVVRVEAVPGARLNLAQRREALDLLLHTAGEPGLAALQVDFDAKRSQRDFYRELLWDLRGRMPPRLPLSITALVSWCSNDNWISDLPVDEAVPMLFRMEPDRQHSSSSRSRFQIREPLCVGSVGISTREAWPVDMDGKRVYVFADRGWREDLPLLEKRKLE
jgi:hypothetical protein